MLCGLFHGVLRRGRRRLRCPWCGLLLQASVSRVRRRIPTAPATPHTGGLHPPGVAGVGRVLERVEVCVECSGPLRRTDEPPGYDPLEFGLCWLCDASSG